VLPTVCGILRSMAALVPVTPRITLVIKVKLVYPGLH
jgi:hypothetical protein